MCIAIYRPAGVQIPFEHLEEGYRSNPDGCGLAWIEDGVIHTFKSLVFDEWVAKYDEVNARCNDPQMLIHFRITSRGKTNLENCHPFMVNDDKVIIHNGTISKIKEADLENGESDTSFFARVILAQLPDGWEHNLIIKYLLEEYIGWSKIVVLDISGEVTFLNEDSGVWDDGIWYSNATYKKYVYTPKNNLPAVGPASNYYSGHNYDNDLCDECRCYMSFRDMSYVNKKWLCRACADKAIEAEKKKWRSEQKKTPDMTLEPVIWRPCGCCNVMFQKSELVKVEVEFRESLDFNPNQATLFQSHLLMTSSLMSEYAMVWLCSDCAELMLELDHDDIVTIEVIGMRNNDISEDIYDEVSFETIH